MTYEATCPTNYPIAEDPDDEDNTQIGFSDCFLGCKTPLYSEDEWDATQRLIGGGAIVNLIAGLMVIFMAKTPWVFLDHICEIYYKIPLKCLVIMAVLILNANLNICWIVWFYGF